MDFQELIRLASEKQNKHNQLIKQIDEQKRLKQLEQRQRLEIATKLYSKKALPDNGVKCVSASSVKQGYNVNGSGSKSKGSSTANVKLEEVKFKAAVDTNLSIKVKENVNAVKDKLEDKNIKVEKKEAKVKKPVERRKELSYSEILELAKKNVPQNIGEKRPFEDLIPCPIDSKYRKSENPSMFTDIKSEKNDKKPGLMSNGKDKILTKLSTAHLKHEKTTSKASSANKGIIEKAVDKIKISNSSPKLSQYRQEKVQPNSSPKTSKERPILQKSLHYSHNVVNGSAANEKKCGILAQLGSRNIMQFTKDELKPANLSDNASKDQKLIDRNMNRRPITSEYSNADSMQKKQSTVRSSTDSKPDHKKSAILAQLSGKHMSSVKQSNPVKTKDIMNSSRKLCPVPSTPPSARLNTTHKSEPKVTSSRSTLSHNPLRDSQTSMPPPPGRGIAAQLGLNVTGLAPRAGDCELYSSEEDYESDDSFIDDSEALQVKEYARVVRDIHRALNFDPRKYKEVNPYDDLRSMEANYKDIEKEERRSERLGAMEDNEELMRDMLRKKKKMMAKQRQTV